MVRMAYTHSTSSSGGARSKVSFYSEAEHDIKQYKRSDDYAVYDFNSDEYEEVNDAPIKNPGWKAIRAFTKAVQNKELTKDDYGLYDVADEHQLAYYFAANSKKEDLGDRVLKALDLLHEIRAEQVRSGCYEKDSGGNFRTHHRKRRGDYTYPQDKLRLAAKMILMGEDLKDAAEAVDADYTHLGQVLKKKFDLSLMDVRRCGNSRLGKEAARMRDAGAEWSEISRILRPEAPSHGDNRVIRTWIKLYESGAPTEYTKSDELKELLNEKAV